MDATAPWHPNDHRHAVAPVAAVPDARGLVDDLLERGRAEIRELHLRDRQQPTERGADGHSDDRRLRDRRVDDAVAAELLDETVGHTEHAATHADVLAEEDVSLIAPELGE